MEQEQKQFKCTGDCLNCRAINERKTQWQYCASQHAYNAMRMVQAMQESFNGLLGKVEELSTKISAIQDSEAMVFVSDSQTEGEKSEIPTLLSGSSEPLTDQDTTQEGNGVIE